MRVQHAQQRFGEAGIAVVEQLADPRVEHGGALDQAFDMRIGAALAARRQGAGQLRIAHCKLRARLPQQAQFTFEIRQQFFHRGIRDNPCDPSRDGDGRTAQAVDDGIAADELIEL
jgi:hypothetical protein